MSSPVPGRARGRAAYYSALLVNVGCHTDAYEQVQWFGDDIALKAIKYAEAVGKLAEMAPMLRLLGSGATPLHRLRVGFEFALVCSGSGPQADSAASSTMRIRPQLRPETSRTKARAVPASAVGK